MSLFDSQAIVHLGNLHRLCKPALGIGKLQPCYNIADLRQPHHRLSQLCTPTIAKNRIQQGMNSTNPFPMMNRVNSWR